MSQERRKAIKNSLIAFLNQKHNFIDIMLLMSNGVIRGDSSDPIFSESGLRKYGCWASTKKWLANKNLLYLIGN